MRSRIVFETAELARARRKSFAGGDQNAANRLAPAARAGVPFIAWLTLLLLTLASAAGAQSNQELRRGTVALWAGTDLPLSAFNAEVETSGLFGTERVFGHSFADIFSRPWELRGEGGVAVSRTVDLFARFGVVRSASRGSVALGESIARFPPAQRTNVARFSGYRAVTIEGGFRRVLRDGRRAALYTGGSAGLARVEAITSTYYCPFGISACAVTAPSVAPTAAALVGVALDPGAHTSIDVETGIRVQGRLTADTSQVSVGFLGESFGGRRVSVPVSVGLRFRF
jgi:hypothetical protein